MLRSASEKEWAELLHWMDISGLALYFLHRVSQQNLRSWIPSKVLQRLEENLKDNIVRTRGLFTDLANIHKRFQSAGISYAILKGFSLWPSSVTHPELRSQLDLDFLLAAADVNRAQAILESMGYHLHAVSGKSWEFKTRYLPSLSLDMLYKSHPAKSVELHLENNISPEHSLLASPWMRSIQGISMPTLPPVELFLGQAMHLYKHVCSPCFRCGHMIEFRNAVLWHHDDQSFWNEIIKRTSNEPRTRLGVGIVTALATRVMGPFAPQILVEATVSTLPSSIRTWVDHYGKKITYSDFPGTKLYLLLLQEIVLAGQLPKRSSRQILLPLRLPPAVIQASPGESISERMQRYLFQLRYIYMRLSFHLLEGARYAIELQRWRRIRALHGQQQAQCSMTTTGAEASHTSGFAS